MKMRVQLFTAAAALLTLSACESEIITPVDFYVTVDKASSMKAGRPVKFHLNGEADYYMFYSGELGHEYRHKDRTEVALSDIHSANLTLLSTPELWGHREDGEFLSLWISDSFEGLTGDRETDMAIMDAEVASGMSKWKNLGYVMGPDQTQQTDVFDVTDYLGHFCLAIHYNPAYLRPGTTQTQGWPTFNMSGTVTVDIEELGMREFRFPNMDRVVVFMNRDEQGRPYEMAQQGYSYWTYDYYYASTYEGTTEFRTHYPTEGLSDEDKTKLSHATTGGVAFGWSQGDIRFTSASNKVHLFDGDIWIVYQPVQLNSVERDTGDVVKTLQNDLYIYEYTYDTPGYYKAVFHGFNVTVDKRYDKQIEIPVIITE